MENLTASLVVTVIGMSVIFAVLAILYVSILSLERIFPYKAPAETAGDNTETVAVIQAAITAYLKRRPADTDTRSIK
ncbi:hypothetical protein MNBD_NITROSPINAE03-557 [hydrothermal vent metagenome]|uniref:Oxaloacetate decarboxylase gamma chain n=1 Tax=hydrothermal vent metagenome TaxID=652676 RepID=A0A3B1BAF7_9ZZZZ